MNRLEELKQRFENEPLAKLLGAKLFHIGDGVATIRTTIKDEFLIVGGFVQGGVTTALADFAGVYAAMSKIPAGHTPAAHIGMHFLRPLSKQDELIMAEGQVMNESRNSLLVQVYVYTKEPKLKAYGVITFSKPRA